MIRIKELIKNIKLISPIIALCIAVASTALGYYVHSYLSREKIVIENISIKPMEVNFFLNDEITKLRSEFRSSSPFFFRDEEVDELNEEEMRRLLHLIDRDLTRNRENIDKYKKDLEIIEKELKLEILTQDSYKIVSSYNETPTEVDQESLKVIKEKITTYKNQKMKSNEKGEALIEKLLSLALNKKENDDFQIDVAMLNYGDIQGLVHGEGKLIFNDDILNLKRAMPKNFKTENRGFEKSFVVIEPRSFSIMNLTVDTYNNRERMLDIARREYLGGYREAFLEIRDIKKTIIRFGPFVFRADMEFEKKENLSKYINNKFSKYLNK